MQVTADGIPVIWHDDLIVSLPEQSSDAVRTQHICELSLRDFKKLSQHRSMGTQTASSSGSFDNSSCSQCSSQSAALIDAAAQQAQHDQSSTSAQLPVGAQTARLARFFSSDQGKRMHSAQAWAVSEEDSLPTLAEVFKVCCSKTALSRSLNAWRSLTTQSAAQQRRPVITFLQIYTLQRRVGAAVCVSRAQHCFHFCMKESWLFCTMTCRVWTRAWALT